MPMAAVLLEEVMDYEPTTVWNRVEVMDHEPTKVAGRHARSSKRRLTTVGLVTAGVLVVSAVAANAATGGRMMPMLANSHTGSAKVANAKVTQHGPANLPQSSMDGGTTVENSKMVDPSYSPSTRPTGTMPSVAFMTVDDRADLTFNQLLGINDSGRGAGYFGSGADAMHPNKGYVVRSDHTHFVNENFPGSVQTQVVGINDEGTTVGFFVDNNGADVGFVKVHSSFVRVANPATTAAPAFNQLLGVNNKGTAAGFYNDRDGASHAYLYQIQTRRFTPVDLPVKADSVVASGINDRGDISGFYTAGKVTSAFVIRNGHVTTLNFGGKTNTQALGLNNSDQVVGSFLDSAGAMHGFVWHDGNTKQIDDPKGTAGTLVNGINNRNQLVGFFVDAKGNTNGFLARLLRS
jgi:uncharacterized membrane protein